MIAALAIVLAVSMIGAIGGCARRQMEPVQIATEPPQASSQAGTIRQIGSTTVLPIAEAWQKKYNERHPDVSIAVSGGGSGTGIKALIAGTAEIADASRAIKDKEKKQADEAGIEPVEHTIAYDGIAVIVHPDNPLAVLSVEQLSDIFSGKVRDWKDVGGDTSEIQIVSRDSASGTYEAFKEMVVTLGKTDKERDYAPEALRQSSNQGVLTIVAQTKTAIGYVGLSYIDDTVKGIRVIPMGGEEAVEATVEAVKDGSYPVSRSLYMYTNGEPAGDVKKYLDWGRGAAGQAIVAELGFVPVSE